MRSAWLLFLVVVLVGCGRDEDPGSWNACVQERTEMGVSGDPPKRAWVEGERWVLLLNDQWGYPLNLTGRTRMGVLDIELPPAPSAGDVIELDASSGFYSEADQGVQFRSEDLVGTIEVLEVRPRWVRLELDVRAVRPHIDREGQGEVAFDGVVVAPRRPYAKCYKELRSRGCL